MKYRWNAWNLEHVREHGLEPEDAELVVDGAEHPYPRYQGGGKYLVKGMARGGRLIQAIFLVDETPGDEETFFVIHARPLSDREKQRFRRQRR